MTDTNTATTTPTNSFGNLLQTGAINELLSKLQTVRGITAVPTVVPNNTVRTVAGYVVKDASVCIQLDAQNFPVIECKKTGRFSLPSIHSYKEGNTPNLLAYPGATAFDAALFADMHVLKQERRAAAKVAVEQAPAPAVEAAVEAPAFQTGAPAAAAEPSMEELEALTAPVTA